MIYPICGAGRTGLLITALLLGSCRTSQPAPPAPAARASEAPAAATAPPAQPQPAPPTSATRAPTAPAAARPALPATPDPATATPKEIRRHRRILRAVSKAEARLIAAAVPAPTNVKIKNSGNTTTETKTKDVGNTTAKIKDQHRERQQVKTDARQISKTQSGSRTPWWLWVLAIIPLAGAGWWIRGKLG